MNIGLKDKKIIIEGPWAVGKTTFCKKAHALGWIFIKEPDHRKTKLKKNNENINIYYILSHISNMIKLLNLNRPAILERSIISAFAYNYAIGDKTWKVLWSYIKISKGILKNIKIFCFYRPYKFFAYDLNKYDRKKFIPRGISQEKFYKRFLQAFRKVQTECPKNFAIIKLEKNQFVSNVIKIL